MNPNELIEWLKEECLWPYFQGIEYEIIINFSVVDSEIKRENINYTIGIPLDEKGIENVLVDLIKNMNVKIKDIEITRKFLIIRNLQSNRYDFDEIESTQDIYQSQVESDFFKRGEQNV